MVEIVLGIEGTAHTFGVGIVEEVHDDGKNPKILSSVSSTYAPPSGGIHPREAAQHHSEVASQTIERALEVSSIRPSEIDLVAFSQGPGLGPCLRTAATAARALALALQRPIVGVNHCVAHLEIGRAVTEAEDPILLYASGGNTQIIAYSHGRYRVVGETLDVGVGNMLDKFAREEGLPFPGGPKIEEWARRGKRLLELPLCIRGMDVAFSGLLTAARALRKKGEPLEDVALSLQETAFAMLVEITERALAHTEKEEVVLGGGVAANDRLWEIVQSMVKERGARAFRPEKRLLVDNGVMIAHLGFLERKRATLSMETTRINPRERTDDVEALWRGEVGRKYRGASMGRYRGAESVVEFGSWRGRKTVVKMRLRRPYVHPIVDSFERSRRTRSEARLLRAAREGGVRTPLVFDVDPTEGRIVLERIEAPQLKEVLPHVSPQEAQGLLQRLGEGIAFLHGAGIVHGDLTTSNVLVDSEDLVFLDFGLSFFSVRDEDRAVDLHVLQETLTSTHAALEGAFTIVLEAYTKGGRFRGVERELLEIERRGRYRGT